eukprot:76836-Pleurochrysis_carterae.AAC.1
MACGCWEGCGNISFSGSASAHRYSKMFTAPGRTPSDETLRRMLPGASGGGRLIFTLAAAGRLAPRQPSARPPSADLPRRRPSTRRCCSSPARRSRCRICRLHRQEPPIPRCSQVFPDHLCHNGSDIERMSFARQSAASLRSSAEQPEMIFSLEREAVFE